MLQHISGGTKVTADDWWNPLTDQVNTNTNDIAAINTNLAKATANGGISDLNTRLSEVESANTTQDGEITALNNALGLPWSGGTAQSRIQALETTVGTTPPYCTIYNPDTFGLGANSNLWAQGGWLVQDDALGMFHSMADSGYSYILIPAAGRYRVEYLSNHDATSGFSVCFVAKNRDVNQSLARDSRPNIPGGGGDGTWIHADNEVALAVNDRLYWADYSSVACNVRGSVFGMKSAKVTIRKVGN